MRVFPFSRNRLRKQRVLRMCLFDLKNKEVDSVKWGMTFFTHSERIQTYSRWQTNFILLKRSYVMAAADVIRLVKPKNVGEDNCQIDSSL